MSSLYSFRAPQLRWPHQAKFVDPASQSQILADHQALMTYIEVTRNLDRIDFLLEEVGGLTVSNNKWFEFSPEIESVVYEIKAHAKTAGAGNLVLRIAINGTPLASSAITLTAASTAVFRVNPNQVKIDPSDKISVDITAVTGTWNTVTLTVILEPRIKWEV